MAQVRWTVPPGVNKRMTQNNAMLILRDLSTEDSGDITCHGDGIVDVTATLTVLGKQDQDVFPWVGVCGSVSSLGGLVFTSTC